MQSAQGRLGQMHCSVTWSLLLLQWVQPSRACCSQLKGAVIPCTTDFCSISQHVTDGCVPRSNLTHSFAQKNCPVMAVTINLILQMEKLCKKRINYLPKVTVQIQNAMIGKRTQNAQFSFLCFSSKSCFSSSPWLVLPWALHHSHVSLLIPLLISYLSYFFLSDSAVFWYTLN